MFHPTRGGTRGGAAQFSWDQVKSEAERENYLGHSVFAPTGRWQNNRDVNWYHKENEKRDTTDDSVDKRRAELLEVKRAEEEAMARALGVNSKAAGPGHAPSTGEIKLGDRLVKGSQGPTTSRTGANRTSMGASKTRTWGSDDTKNQAKQDPSSEHGDVAPLSKEERRLARKIAKNEVKESERAKRHEMKRQMRMEESYRNEPTDERRRSGRTNRSKGYDIGSDTRGLSAKSYHVKANSRSLSPRPLSFSKNVDSSEGHGYENASSRRYDNYFDNHRHRDERRYEGERRSYRDAYYDQRHSDQRRKERNDERHRFDDESYHTSARRRDGRYGG